MRFDCLTDDEMFAMSLSWSERRTESIIPTHVPLSSFCLCSREGEECESELEAGTKHDADTQRRRIHDENKREGRSLAWFWLLGWGI